MRSDDCRQILRNWNAQNEFNYHERAEDIDFREANAASNFPLHGTTARVTCNAFARTCFVQREFRPTADVDPRARRSRGTSRAAGIVYCGAVVVKRYEIVTRGGVLSTQPPLAVVYLEGSFS